MSPRTAATPRLSDADLVRLMALIKEANSVELKVTVPSDSHRATVLNLPIDPVEAQPRQVFFFDTPDLDLDRAGLVVRARRIQGGRADTVVKLRPVEPTSLPDEFRYSASFNVEVDALPGGFVCSGSMKGRSTGQQVRDAVSKQVPLRKIFTKEQRAFYSAYAPSGMALDDLQVLGPTFILKATFTPKALQRRFVAEVWLYPDGSRILELSTKCLPTEAFQVAAEARAYLADRGVVVSGVQQTKTRTAMRFYQAQLKQSALAAEIEAGTPPRRRGRPRKDAAGGATATTTTAPATAGKASTDGASRAAATKPKRGRATTARRTPATTTRRPRTTTDRARTASPGS
jgi:hypothetical protein